MQLTTHEKIANRFAEARENAGKTQADVADFLNVTYQAVSNWERGKTKIDSISLLSCLLWFKVDIYKFLEDCDFEIMARAGSENAIKERELVNMFYSLNTEGKEKLLTHAKDLKNAGYTHATPSEKHA